MAIFTYTPDWNARISAKPRVRAVSFGDGYEQRTGDGINSAADSWSLTFASRSNADSAGIVSFLVVRAAVESFDWTPPNESTAIRVVCREWQRTYDRYDFNTITATFDRVYEP